MTPTAPVSLARQWWEKFVEEHQLNFVGEDEEGPLWEHAKTDEVQTEDEQYFTVPKVAAAYHAHASRPLREAAQQLDEVLKRELAMPQRAELTTELGRVWAALASALEGTAPLAPSCPYKIGDFVSWKAQNIVITERILRITEPQPGNYILWTTLDGKEKFGNLPADFPINYQQVKLVPGVTAKTYWRDRRKRLGLKR